MGFAPLIHRLHHELDERNGRSWCGATVRLSHLVHFVGDVTCRQCVKFSERHARRVVREEGLQGRQQPVAAGVPPRGGSEGLPTAPDPGLRGEELATPPDTR